MTTFTVDPADAKDFDDALSVRRVRDGVWEIGVHIADVTHYVRPQSTIDDEAVERGTSVYLVDRTVPSFVRSARTKRVSVSRRSSPSTRTSTSSKSGSAAR